MLRFDESPAEACRGCGSDIGRSALACPHCGALVHREELERLAREAREAEEGGRLPDAFAALRRMLELLPAGTRQRSAVSARVDELGRRGIVPSPLRTAPAASPDVDASPRPAGRGWKLGKRFGFLGAAGLLLWKLKSLLVIVGSKFKLVLLGLGKLQTLGSMLLSFGVYWSLWGWSFAAGLVIMIYLHEMGHVWALRRYGIAATAPMFIPGFGAMIRLRQYPASVRENAEVGLAGPMWGMWAAAGCAGLYALMDAPILGAIAHVAAWINFFNLLPAFGLDGAHGFGALSRRGAWVVAAGFAAAYFATGDGLVLLVTLVAGFRALSHRPVEAPDPPTLWRFLALTAGLTALLFLSPDVT